MTKQPTWVKCSERMPEREDFYWVINPRAKVGRQRECYYKEGKFLRRDTATECWRFELSGVTHWLDCPDPEPDDGFEAWWLSLERVPGIPSYMEFRKVQGSNTCIHQAREIWQAALKANGIERHTP